MENATTFEEFAAKHGITLEAESIPFRPEQEADAFASDALHFAITIRKGSTIIWRGNYSVGSAYPLYWVKTTDNRCGLSPVERMEAKKFQPFKTNWTLHEDAIRQRIIERYKSLAPLDMADVLESVWSDIRLADGMTFDDFCAELGYDPDSRKAFRSYEACQAIARSFSRGLGQEVFSEFLSMEP